MNELTVLEVGREALLVILRVAGPVMAIGLVAGLVVALFQALTTIQEITLTFAPKIIIVFTAVVVLLPFMMTVLLEFSRQLFDRMTTL